MAEFEDTRRQTEIQQKHNTGQNRCKKKTNTFLGQICKNRKHTGTTQCLQNFKTN